MTSPYLDSTAQLAPRQKGADRPAYTAVQSFSGEIVGAGALFAQGRETVEVSR